MSIKKSSKIPTNFPLIPMYIKPMPVNKYVPSLRYRTDIEDIYDLSSIFLNDMFNCFIHQIVKVISILRGDKATWERKKIKNKAIRFFHTLENSKYYRANQNENNWMIPEIKKGKTLIVSVIENTNNNSQCKANKANSKTAKKPVEKRKG